MTKELGRDQESIKALTEALLAQCLRHYGDRLVSLVLYGSVARGTHHGESDLDVFLIATGLPRGRMKRQEEFDAVEEALWGSLGISAAEPEPMPISVVFKTPDEALAGSPLFLDMVEDARILYDRDDFFRKVLTRLAERLKVLGAKRIRQGSAWYWDLKPDYKPGEIFEL